jgi:hypothetical protein
MEFRVISVRPRTTVGTVATGVAIVAVGAALLVVGATLLLGVAVIGATAGAATLVYRRLTGRGAAGWGSSRPEHLSFEPAAFAPPPPDSASLDPAVPDRGDIGPTSGRQSLHELARAARLGLDPRMEVQVPPAGGTDGATTPNRAERDG